MRTTASASTSQFADLLERLPADIDLDSLALETKAIRRKRKIGDGASLLRLALARGPGGFSLRQTSDWMSLQEIGELSNPGVHDRLTQAADFIVRLGWNALQLSTPDGQPFDLIDDLRHLPAGARRKRRLTRPVWRCAARQSRTERNSTRAA